MLVILLLMVFMMKSSIFKSFNKDAKKTLNKLDKVVISRYHISVDEGTDKKITYINVPIDTNT